MAELPRPDLPGGDREPRSTDDHSLPLQTLRDDGQERRFLIARPSNAARAGGYPVVIGLHGGVQRFHEFAAGEALPVVSPNGIGAEWSDGRGTTFQRHGDLTADDVGFLSALIDHLVQHEGASPSRIYIAGASNGAMTTHRGGCELADKLAAIAPMIAPMPASGCTAQRLVDSSASQLDATRKIWAFFHDRRR